MKRVLAVAATLLALGACAGGPPNPAALDTRNETCGSCRMPVSDASLAAQIVAPGEEARFFDDIACLRDFLARSPPLREERSRTSPTIARNRGYGLPTPSTRARPRDADGLALDRARDGASRDRTLPRGRDTRRRRRDLRTGRPAGRPLNMPSAAAAPGSRPQSTWMPLCPPGADPGRPVALDPGLRRGFRGARSGRGVLGLRPLRRPRRRGLRPLGGLAGPARAPARAADLLDDRGLDPFSRTRRGGAPLLAAGCPAQILLGRLLGLFTALAAAQAIGLGRRGSRDLPALRASSESAPTRFSSAPPSP